MMEYIRVMGGTEAQKRNIYTPYDLTELEHDEYEEKWNGFCDAYFAQGDE